MNLELDDRVIFVTGASQGIGLGIVEACLAEGAKVAFTARRPEPLKEAADALIERYGADRIWTMAGDMRDSETVETAVTRVEEEFGPIWGAVANVGGYRTKPGVDIPDEMWEGSIMQNLHSSQRLSRSVLGRMMERGEGSFLIISSIAGIKVFGTPVAYGTPKAALIHMAKELAKIVGPKGVRVNSLSPGNITFPKGYWEQAMDGPMREQTETMLKNDVALQRFGTAEEIGRLATFLLSPVSGFTTGANFVADGGQAI